ncbi:MAG: amidohydrolase family protein [Halanaerobiales bacterium]|nr:amidohydrolase family protein [Halanaerobiales bacterium]
MITLAEQGVIEQGWLLIEEGRIIELGSPMEMIEPDRADESIEIVDLSDYCLLPGLIDCHTHLSIIPGEGDQLGQMRLPGQINILRSIPNLYQDLAAGVTTMRVMGEEHYIDLDLKKAIKQGLIAGPRLLTSGIGIVATNGHGAALTVCDGVEAIRKQIRRNFARGGDLVKIFATGGVSSPASTLEHPGYSREEIRTAVEEAERVGSYVAAHAHGGKGMDYCIDEGVRTLEHAALVSEQQVERIMEKDLWIIGTFSILFHPEGIEKTDLKTESIREKVMRAREFIRENFSRVLKKGFNLALGTDSMHGQLAWEAEFVNELGLSNQQAIRAITSDAARACRIEEDLGTLEKGKLADLLAVEGDPLEDLASLRRVKAVFKEGERMI